MKQLIALCTFLALTLPLTGGLVKKTIPKKYYSGIWYCIYCGFANDDKYTKCRNWSCPTNKSIE